MRTYATRQISLRHLVRLPELRFGREAYGHHAAEEINNRIKACALELSESPSRLNHELTSFSGARGSTMRKLIEQLEPGAVIKPETIKILVSAFDRAWTFVGSSGTHFSLEEYAEAPRALLARHIIESLSTPTLIQT
jgi:hypothetical protein